MSTLACSISLLFLITASFGCRDSKKVDFPNAEQIRASIDAFNDRKIYRTLEVATLREIPDDELEQVIIDYVGTKIDGNYEEEPKIVRSLPESIRAIYVTWWVESEVRNGGFNQFFWNSHGVFAEDAVKGYEFLGAPEHAALLREAIAVSLAEEAIVKKFKNKNSRESFSESYQHTKLTDIDKKFHKLGDDLGDSRIKVIREKPELFTGH